MILVGVCGVAVREPATAAGGGIVHELKEQELNERIDRELRCHNGVLPPLTNAAWRGYLAACIEWGLIGTMAHARLLDKLPPLDSDPSVNILLGCDSG
ncbi:MAG: hypothetical protein QM820_23275 [Minicystis sp.]